MTVALVVAADTSFPGVYPPVEVADVCTAKVPALVTACEGTEARETGRVVIAAAPSDNLTKAGVPTGASTVNEPALSETGITVWLEAIATGAELAIVV